jgi:hypothetical protein
MCDDADIERLPLRAVAPSARLFSLRSYGIPSAAKNSMQ